MNRKYLYIIPLMLVEVVIQLGFFWLAPDNECRWLVYLFLTVMTVVHLAIAFVMINVYGARRSAAAIVAGSFVQLVIIGVSILLLLVNAPIRSTIYPELILAVSYVAIVTIFWIAIERKDDTVESVARPTVGCTTARRTPPAVPTRH